MAKRRTPPPTDDAPTPDSPTGWRAHRREITFLVVFLVLLAASFTLIAWQPVNDGVIVPFTAGVARVSGWTLDLLGQDVTMRGTVIRNDRFAVNIENGCNGVEAMLIFVSRGARLPGAVAVAARRRRRSASSPSSSSTWCAWWRCFSPAPTCPTCSTPRTR